MYSIATGHFGRSYNDFMPQTRTPHWYLIPVRVLLVTFLLTLLSFAMSLLVGIAGVVIKARIHDAKPNMAIAYRHVALPVALAACAIALIAASILEVRQYRQSRTLAQIARASR